MPSTTSSAVSVVFDFFNRDHALAADLVHGVGNKFADRRVIVCRNGGHLRRFLAGLDRTRQRFQGFDRAFGRPIEAALDVDCAGAGHHVAHAVGENGMRQDCRGAGSVTNHVAGLLRRLAEHAGAEIFFRILEIEFLGDGHAVVAHDRRTPFSLDQHRLLTAVRASHARNRQVAQCRAISFPGQRSGRGLAYVPWHPCL